MSVYIGYCFYLCGETAQAAGDVADGAFLLVDKLLKIPDPFAQHHHLFA